MPRGEHFYTCLGCGGSKTCGDCIPLLCPDCDRKDQDLRKAGWRSMGMLGTEYASPGTKICTLQEAWEQLHKPEHLPKGFSLWEWRQGRWLECEGDGWLVLWNGLFKALPETPQAAAMVVRVQGRVFRAVRGEQAPTEAPAATS